jgi:hypothetical protein
MAGAVHFVRTTLPPCKRRNLVREALRRPLAADLYVEMVGKDWISYTVSKH